MTKNELASLIEQLRDQHRLREDFHRAEKRIVLQMKAICRRYCDGDKDKANDLYDEIKPDSTDDLAKSVMPLLTCRDELYRARKGHEKRMVAIARQIPAYEWVGTIRGFGELGFAQIVAETGDLSNYDNPAKVWKRMGLAVFNGKSQRRVSGDAALEQGYCPRRRAIMFCIGDSMIKSAGSPYRDIYLDRKDYERMTAAANGMTVAPAAKITAKDKDTHISDGHIHRRAQRYMEKRLLRDLWAQWKAQGV